MIKNLASEISIGAPPQQVWEVLSDFAAYPQWNPFIVAASGRAETGARLTLRLQPVVGRPTTVRPTVTEVRAGALLRWSGRLGIRGLLDAEHTFRLEPRSGNGTRLVQEERFSGLLVPFVARMLQRGTLPAFVRMEEALKTRAERSVGTPRG